MTGAYIHSVALMGTVVTFHVVRMFVPVSESFSEFIPTTVGVPMNVLILLNPTVLLAVPICKSTSTGPGVTDE